MSHEAQDSTQEFFARFLEKNYLQNVMPERGKFRSYLLGALKHFLANERDRARAQKRGGGRRVLSLDFEKEEGRCGFEPSDHVTPEKIFDRSWALALLDRVLVRLEDEFVKAGKEATFGCLKVFLTGESGAPSYKQVAAELELTEGTVKVTIHRMRGRYRKILKELVGETVADAAEIEDEIRYLMTAVAN